MKNVAIAKQLIANAMKRPSFLLMKLIDAYSKTPISLIFYAIVSLQRYRTTQRYL
jgi:hypothetical protein